MSWTFSSSSALIDRTDMITDEQVRWIALFFLFSLMDEKVALQAAHKTVGHLKAVTNGRGFSDESDARVAIIKAVRRNYDVYRKQVPRNKPSILPESAWSLADHVDIAPWAKFQKDAPDNEIVAVVLKKLLLFSDHEIAAGLGITLGTARYRIGKGMRQLGQLCEKAGAMNRAR